MHDANPGDRGIHDVRRCGADRCSNGLRNGEAIEAASLSDEERRQFVDLRMRAAFFARQITARFAVMRGPAVAAPTVRGAVRFVIHLDRDELTTDAGFVRGSNWLRQ